MKRLTFDALLAATMMMGPAAWAGAPGADDKVVVPDNSPSSTGTVPAQSQPRERNTTPTTTPTPTTPDDPERHGRTGFPAGTQSAPDPTNPHIPGPAPTDTPRVPGPTAGTEGDLDVVTKVHQANQKEIEMAQMALDKAESPRVKAYARKLLNEHQAADKKLMTYADKKKLDLGKVEQPATGTTAAPKADSDAHALVNATGAEFDRQFINMMLEEHDKAIDLVKSAKDSVTDQQLRTFLTGVLPKLEQHRKMARELADKQSKS
jgi:putative membrane protein